MNLIIRIIRIHVMVMRHVLLLTNLMLGAPSFLTAPARIDF